MNRPLLLILAACSCLTFGCGLSAEISRAYAEALATAMNDPASRTELAVSMAGPADIWIVLPSETAGMVECAMAASRDGSTNWCSEVATLTCDELRDNLRQDASRPWLIVPIEDLGNSLFARADAREFILLTEVERCALPAVHSVVCESLARAGWTVDKSRLIAQRPTIESH